MMLLRSASLVVICLVLGGGCTEAPQKPMETASASSQLATVDSAGPGAAAGAPPRESDPAVLAAALRPIDSDLPTRASLEAGYEDPVGLLLQIGAASWPDTLERQNALSELGLFPDDQRAMDRLFGVALASEASMGDRVAALQGLARAGTGARSRTDVLVQLLDVAEPRVQSATVLLVAGWPEAAGRLSELARDPSTHPDVRRLATQALDSE